jgi:endoglucanase
MNAFLRTSLLLAMLLSGTHAELHAQAASALDTAPGANAGTNSAATPAAPAPPPVPAGTTLVSNGDLESATKTAGWPDDWDKTEYGTVTWKADGAKHYFNLVSQKPQEHVQVYRIIAIPLGVTGIEFSARYRVAGLKPGRFPEDDARTILEFLRVNRKPLAAAPPVVFSADAATWTNITERIAVPPDISFLAIMPCLYRVDAGTLDIAKIEVTTLSDADSATVRSEAATAAAKKLADQQAILDQEIVAPSKSLEIHTSGNRLFDPQGKDVLLQGLNICNLSIRTDEEHVILWAAHIALTDWHANVIRLPVLDSFWFGKGRGTITSNDAEAYRAIADKVIKIAAGKGAYVVFDLHRYLTPDDTCVAFWKDAAVRYKNNPAVLFDVLNEPHDTTWEVWRNGGPVEVKQKDGTKKTVQGVGMQALVNAVRGAGAKNIIVAGGLGYAFDLTGIVNGYALDDKGGNGIMYATHFYNWHGGWSKHIMGTAAKYPVLVGECGADINKMDFIPANKQENPYTWAPDAIGYIQKNHLNWTAWCMHTKATPDMLLDWEYSTPTSFWGAFVKDALNGQVYDMKKER